MSCRHLTAGSWKGRSFPVPRTTLSLCTSDTLTSARQARSGEWSAPHRMWPWSSSAFTMPGVDSASPWRNSSTPSVSSPPSPQQQKRKITHFCAVSCLMLRGLKTKNIVESMFVCRGWLYSLMAFFNTVLSHMPKWSISNLVWPSSPSLHLPSCGTIFNGRWHTAGEGALCQSLKYYVP